MMRPAITIGLRDHDFLAAIYGGDVAADGIDVTVDRRTPMAQAAADPAFGAAELSFSRFLMGLSRGDRTFVGIPFFPIRAFRHRCLFVRRDSGLDDMRQLEGARVGTNGWPDTGNTWTRAVLRDRGVRLERIHWLVGPVDERNPTSPPGALPAYAEPAPSGRLLRDMLLDGDVDALVCPVPPEGFYADGSRITRLIADYRRAEREYYQRTRIFPPHHIVGVRRPVFEQAPHVAAELYQVLDKARLLWQRQRLYMAELVPWVLAEMEETVALMGDDWKPSGVSANRAAIRGLCEEMYAQGLVDRPIDPAVVFAEFDAGLST
jgi:4,5-dihydroxyphthalate decarboxylase